MWFYSLKVWKLWSSAVKEYFVMEDMRVYSLEECNKLFIYASLKGNLGELAKKWGWIRMLNSY